MPRLHDGAPQPSEKDEITARAGKLRAEGYSYALIGRELGIPYLKARELAAHYDAKRGKPKQVVRRIANTTPGTGPTSIPMRDLRNETSRILRQVENGQRFLITVSGRVVAELRPAARRATWVPRAVVEKLIREAQLDPQFKADVGGVMGERIDEL